MGVMLIAVGVVMWIGDRIGSRQRQVASAGLTDALVIGVAQVLALVPGCSRSGITVTAGLFRDFDREAAARFSFLLSTPAIGGAAAKAVWDVYKAGAIGELFTAQFAVGVVVSGLVGCAVIAWFLHYLRRNSLNSFVYYRIIFGIIVLALAFIRRPA
jgi:undecaprenyl-diphosphatase